MIKISKITIQRFRSIMSMELKIDNDNNIISICGPNNVGKTNTLRAMNLFFNPDQYNPKLDIPTLKNATWGGLVHPKITIEFTNENDLKYVLTRDFKSYNKEDVKLSGYNIDSLKNKLELSQDQLDDFISKIHFFYIESANMVIPDIIEKITQDMITLEYDKTRFTKNKSSLREAYNTYIDGLQEILDIFANEISGTFQSFRDSWSVVFNVPKNSETFRDLISDDVTLTIEDKGSNGIIEKGSGLQWLALILLQFEIAYRVPKGNAIVCIDEPDAFLHEGLQRKLRAFIDNKSIDMQIFLTTHSKVFIDTYGMKNTILLDAKLSDQYVKRRNKNIDVVETYSVNVNTEEGYRIICQHLGIEEKGYEILQKHNLLVEGECDKKYISELSKYFKFNEINIIPANGADNIVKYLDFYESYFKNYTTFTPKIKILLDNDPKGREIFKKLQAKRYSYININLILISNFLDDSNKGLERNSTNNEIEDFLYPDILCYLVNSLLKNRGLNQVNTKEICLKIHTNAFKSAGILNLCEHEKNVKNPDVGDQISFISSHESTNRIKEGLAGLFNIEGNRAIIDMLNACNIRYPKVKNILKDILTFDMEEEP